MASSNSHFYSGSAFIRSDSAIVWRQRRCSASFHKTLLRSWLTIERCLCQEVRTTFTALSCRPLPEALGRVWNWLLQASPTNARCFRYRHSDDAQLLPSVTKSNFKNLDFAFLSRSTSTTTTSPIRKSTSTQHRPFSANVLPCPGEILSATLSHFPITITVFAVTPTIQRATGLRTSASISVTLAGEQSVWILYDNKILTRLYGRNTTEVVEAVDLRYTTVLFPCKT